MALKTLRDEQPGLNMTPMIDILFLLIIFFMVGTRFSELTEEEKKLDLNVPEVSTASTLTAAPRKRVINVFPDGSITLDEQALSLAELTDVLNQGKQQFADLGVVVRGDAAAFYQHVADVLAACREAEITDLGISVRVSRQRGNASR